MAAAPGGACRVRVFRESPGVWRVKASCEGTDSGFEATESVWVGALADAHFHFRTQHHVCDQTWMTTWTEERGFHCKVCGEPMSPTLCRSCWLATLSEDERQRAAAEPVAGTIHLCEEHQQEWDALAGRLPTRLFTRSAVGEWRA